jgi:hypothetical protein
MTSCGNLIGLKENGKAYNMTLQICWNGLIIYDAITKRVLNNCARGIKQGVEIIV